MTQTLEQLSAAATELLPCPFCGREARIMERVTGPNGPGFFCAVSCYCGGYSANAHQSATSNNDQMARVKAITRWNQRTGQLVAVSDDAVERVARAICEASGEAWRSGEGLRYPFSQNARQLNNHWLYKAKAAIAAMKDTQP